MLLCLIKAGLYVICLYWILPPVLVDLRKLGGPEFVITEIFGIAAGSLPAFFCMGYPVNLFRGQYGSGPNIRTVI